MLFFLLQVIIIKNMCRYTACALGKSHCRPYFFLSLFALGLVKGTIKLLPRGADSMSRLGCSLLLVLQFFTARALLVLLAD